MLGLLILLAFAAALVVLVLTIVIAYDATHPARRTGAYAAARGLPFDPGDLGYTFEEWTLDRPDGARLPVWEIALQPDDAPAREAAAGGAVVLVHGWGESRIDMLALLEDLRSVASRAVLYDLRGHGEASFASRLGNREDDDLLALLERLGDENRVTLIGRELGANIAMAAAAQDHESIAGVVAIAPYADFHVKLRERLAARDFPARPMTDLALAWFSLTGRAPVVVDEQTQSRIARPMLELAEFEPQRVRGFLNELRP